MLANISIDLHSYVCIYIYIYKCMCIYIHIYIWTCIHGCNIHTYQIIRLMLHHTQQADRKAPVAAESK